MSDTVKCIIVDDEPLAIQIIEGYISRVPQLKLCGTCSDAMEAFQLLGSTKVDLMFLDIEMPGLTGIDFLKSITDRPQVIFTTAYREYAFDSYEVGVVDYLLKPVSFSRFFKAISKYQQLNTPSGQAVVTPQKTQLDGGSIYVYADKKNVKVYFSDIRYIESIKDYVRLHLEDKNVVSKDTISRYEASLPSQFIRVHRSYIVNTEHITAFTHQDIEIGDKEIPIGASYKRSVIESLKGGS